MNNSKSSSCVGVSVNFLRLRNEQQSVAASASVKRTTTKRCWRSRRRRRLLWHQKLRQPNEQGHFGSVRRTRVSWTRKRFFQRPTKFIILTLSLTNDQLKKEREIYKILKVPVKFKFLILEEHCGFPVILVLIVKIFHFRTHRQTKRCFLETEGYVFFLLSLCLLI